MSSLSIDVQIATLNEVGNGLDDALEAATAELQRTEGAYAAVQAAARHVANLGDVIEVDLRAEKISEAEAATARLWVARASQVCENLARNAANAAFLARGAHSQNEKLVKQIKGLYDLALARRARLEAEPADAQSAPAIDAGGSSSADRPSPAPRSIKETRLSAALAAEIVEQKTAAAHRRPRRAKKAGA